MNIGKTISLDERRRAVLDEIESFAGRHGRSPSYAELASALHYSKATVGRVVASLREDGLVGLECESNSILPQRLLEEAFHVLEVPVLASISCGQPEYAEEDRSESLRMSLPPELNARGEYYALTAHGLSMIDTDIDPDSVILIDSKRQARPGNIVVALVDGEATLKRYYPKSDGVTVELRPENQQMESIYVNTELQSFAIQGVAVMMQKMLI